MKEKHTTSSQSQGLSSNCFKCNLRVSNKTKQFASFSMKIHKCNSKRKQENVIIQKVAKTTYHTESQKRIK